MKQIFLLLLSALVLFPASGLARSEQEPPSVEARTGLSANKAFLPEPDEAIIQISGAVCSFCSLGIQRKIATLSFVDQSRFNKGSVVDIKTQRIRIALKPGGRMDLVQVYQAILQGGYEPVMAIVASEEGLVTYDDKRRKCSDTAPC